MLLYFDCIDEKFNSQGQSTEEGRRKDVRCKIEEYIIKEADLG